MRVFVVSTGRCGTCTFFQACSHINNYTTNHEIGRAVLEIPNYKDNAIQIDSRLVIFMATLQKQYPSARWIHLRRDKVGCCDSLANSNFIGLIDFARLHFQLPYPDLTTAAELYYDLINETIARMMPSNGLSIELEEAYTGWKDVWNFIGAEGDFESSRNEFKRRYNPREHRGKFNYILTN